MKMNHIPRLLVVAGVLILGLLGSCSRSYENLVYQDVRNIRLLSLSLDPEIGMDVAFYNPNPYPLHIREAELDLFFNEEFVGKGTLNNRFLIPARDTFLLPIKLKSSLKGIFSQAYQLLSNQQIDIEVKGDVQAGRAALIRIPIHYRTRQHLNVQGF